MKRLLAVLVVLCMIIGIVPAISFAADTVITSNTTALFTPSSGLLTTEGSAESGGSCVLVAWNHSDNWNAAGSFTDTDGTVTNQSVTSGTPFGTSRNAVVSFDIPADFDPDSTAKVTLGITVRFIKQINQAGARLAVYGNSVSGKWSTSSSTSVFGVNGSDSGLAGLPLLGLTSPVNAAGNNQVDQEVTLETFALTEYVKKMAKEGMSQVTFRLAVPYGGMWIYNSTSSHPATLKIEEGALTSVNVKTVYMDGTHETSSSSKTVTNIVTGSTYTYTEAPASYVNIGEDIYIFNAEKSTLSVEAAADGTSKVVIYYEKYSDSNSFSGYEFEDEGAWCWFADPRAISYKNDEGTLDFTIIGYIDVHGSIKAIQVDNLTNEVNEVLVRSNIQPDDHNNPTFLVLPDERIIVFYSRHTDERCFWYRVTKEPGDLTTLGEEKCLNTDAATTYPSPFLLSDDPDHIYLAWRGIEWHPTMAQLSLPDSDGNVHFTWGPRQVIRSTAQGSGCRPYAKYTSNGKDSIFITYTATHPDNVDPNSIYYTAVKFTDFTEGAVKVALQGVKGNTLTTSLPFTVNNNETDSSYVVDPRSTSRRGWVWQIAIAEDGYPVIAMVRISSNKQSHDYYYAKWNGTEWVKTFLDNAGGAFHQSKGLEQCYSGGMAIDPDNTNIIYASVPVEGVFGKVYEIIKYTMSDDAKSIVAREQVTYNSRQNNVRPFVIPNSEGDALRLTWMHGEYYDWIVSNAYTTRGYCTSLMAESALPEKSVVEDAILVEDYEEIGGAFVSKTYTGNVIEVSGNDAFTISADIYLGGDYEGALLDMGTWALNVERRSTQYGATVTGDRARLVLTNGESEFVSTNVYGSSDCWTSFGRGTGGNYGVENYNHYVNITITYDGENVVIYRDGALDIKASIDAFEFDNLTVGGFDGYCENVAVYDRVVNYNEIKALSEVDYIVTDPGVAGEKELTVYYDTISGNEFKKDIYALSPRTNYYNFIPDDYVIEDGIVYKLSDYSFTEATLTTTAVYEKMVDKGANLVTDGSFEDENGNFSWGTWQTPRYDGGYLNKYFKDNCNDWFYVVNGDTNSAVLYNKNNIAKADNYVLGTRWNDGEEGLCSMANFIPVKAGKVYRVAYDYKHSNAGTDSAYISTAFVKDKNFAANGSGNNIPVDVTTSWKTNEFIITAPEDGYIYFHFSWLGADGNPGNGPYWYFDNFEVFELEKDAINAKVIKSDAVQTVVSVNNVSGGRIENIKVYAVSMNGDMVTNSEIRTISLDGNSGENLEFNVTGNVKVYIWDADMKPIHEELTN